MSYSTENIRNVALAGHPGVGKTSLFEALLHAGGAIAAQGSLERGTTVSDFDPIEKKRGHSIDAAIASTDHSGVHLNLIDTPGYPDFRGPALGALEAVETVAIVVDAATGIQYGTRRMMEYAKGRNLCRVIVVNKIDTDDADPAAVLDSLRETFGNEVLPLNLPADGGSAVVDCFGRSDRSDTDLGSVAEWHQRILDQVVEVNETVMDRYLDLGEEALTGQELHDAFEQCLREGHLVPVCFVSARTGVGVTELLDVAERLFPHPGEANYPTFVKGSGADATELQAVPNANAHVIADVFKIVNDPFVGKLGVFRVYQGTIRPGTQLFVDDGSKPFKVNHLFKLKGREHVEIPQAVPGDIAAIAKVDDLHFDAVLHDSHDEDRIHLTPMPFPKPMFAVALNAASKGQEEKLATALHKLAEEDPVVTVEHTELNETVLRGLSDLHLRVLLDKLRDVYGVEVTTHAPRIAYRETIGGKAEGHHRHKKQTGGAGQFGEVYLRIEPLQRGEGFEFHDEVKGGAIPGSLIPAVEKGVRQVLATGAVAGYPMQDIRVTVYDGKYHPVDSKEVAFVAAGKKAFLDAVTKAQPQVLEPVVDLEVSAPDHHMGDISGGLASKRARINGTETGRDGEILVRAQVPLSELEGYAAELKSVTAGRGRYSLDFSHYEPVPAQVQHKLVSAYRPGHEDD